MPKKSFIILLFLILVSAVNSYASENGYSYKTGCRYNNYREEDCIGKVGYIHITPWQEDRKKNKNLICKLSIFMERNPKKLDDAWPLKGLPKVGSVVEPNNRLIFYQDLEQIKRQYEICDKGITEIDKRVDYRKSGFKSAAESKLCGISGCLAIMNEYESNGEEDVVRVGHNLKILSYERLKQGLFAKIKVVPNKTLNH